MEDKINKQDNKKSLDGCGYGCLVGILLTILYGFGVYDLVGKRLEIEKIKAEKGYIIQNRDLNGDGKQEQFIEIESVRYFQSIDGENLEDRLDLTRGAR